MMIINSCSYAKKKMFWKQFRVFFFLLVSNVTRIFIKETYGETLIKWHKFKLTFVNNCSGKSRCITSTFLFNWLVNLSKLYASHWEWNKNCFVSTRNCLMCVCSWWQLSNSNVIHNKAVDLIVCIPFGMIVLHLSCLRYDIIPSYWECDVHNCMCSCFLGQ